MITVEKLKSIQKALQDEKIDCWLFRVFQKSDPISDHFLGLGDKFVSRRAYYIIFAHEPPLKIVHKLEPYILDHLPGERKETYLRWEEHEKIITKYLLNRKVACQYSPRARIPSVSRLDYGTVELLTSANCKLVSSADLVQKFCAVWSKEQLETHLQSAELLYEIMIDTFRFIAFNLSKGKKIDEYTAQQKILKEFSENGLITNSPPIVAIAKNAADPHYQPSNEKSDPIKAEDLVLIDLWAKLNKKEAVYADITWVAIFRKQPTDKERNIFSIVKKARDEALHFIRRNFPHREIRGYEVDDIARKVIENHGYGEYFIHRTGHSIDTEDHGQGANLDNLETHDERTLLPWTGFSIEPGIYIPGDIGIRLEINVYLTENEAKVSGNIQEEILRFPI